MEQETAAGRHPYRSKPVTLAPDLDGRNRRLAVRGVSIVLGCLLFRLPVLALSPLAILAFELVLLFGTWLFTMRCHADGRVTRTLAWALRLMAIVESVCTILPVLDTPPWNHAGVLYMLNAVVVPALGVLFLAARLHSFGLPKVARRVLWVLAPCIAGPLLVYFGNVPYGLVLPYLLVGLPLYVGTWIWGFVVMVRLHRALRVELQEWWLDVEARPRVEWTSYALLGDRRVELVGPDGKVSWFDNQADASVWLTQRGFCRHDQVMKERLIPEAAVQPLLQAQVKTG